MSDEVLEPRVEEFSYESGKKTFEKNLNYAQPLKKNTDLARISGIALSLFGLIMLFLRNDPPHEETKDSKGFELPGMTYEQVDLTKGQYSRVEDVKNVEQKNKAKNFAKIKLSPPKLITRSVKIKIPPGSEVRAQLINGASNGLVKAKLLDDLMAAGELLLSAGTIVIGQGASGEDRLFIKFNKAVFEDGSISQLQAEAADTSDKIMGLKGSKIASHATKMAASAGLNFLAGASAALEDTQGEQGAVVTKPTMRNAILHGTAKAAVEEANNIASQYKNAPTILAVKVGTEILVIFNDDGG
ncbi:MAG: hypothetical protein A4S09_03325 [Proteobacteria bacterium SG_bin7]|nr:MAG: hypothetical protein A4S09_03325 [Proteobacteria bacterium SG_bin7]